MYLVSKGVIEGVIGDVYGKRGDVNEFGMPTRSIPFKIEGMPFATKTCALIFEDRDSAPTSGFSWIHWLAANIKKGTMEDNESANSPDSVQGANSWSSKYVGNNPLEKTCCYGGPSPEDGTHQYDLTIFALDIELDLKNGFYLNDLYKAMHGHILTKAYLSGTYDS